VPITQARQATTELHHQPPNSDFYSSTFKNSHDLSILCMDPSNTNSCVLLSLKSNASLMLFFKLVNVHEEDMQTFLLCLPLPPPKPQRWSGSSLQTSPLGVVFKISKSSCYHSELDHRLKVHFPAVLAKPLLPKCPVRNPPPLVPPRLSTNAAAVVPTPPPQVHFHSGKSHLATLLLPRPGTSAAGYKMIVAGPFGHVDCF
jgi:hypothetical protein